MKRIFPIALFILLAITAFTGCESAQDKLDKELEAVYSQIRNMSFSDESVLTDDDFQRLNELNQQKERAYQEKDIDMLREIKEQWDIFRAPIQAQIDEIIAEKRRIAEEEARKAEEAAQKAIDEIVTESQAAADMLTAFSFGTMDLSITSKNHTIVYSYQYNIDIGDADSMKSGLELSTSLLSSTFQACVESMKAAEITNASVIVEYKEKTGSIIFSKEFK